MTQYRVENALENVRLDAGNYGMLFPINITRGWQEGGRGAGDACSGL